MVDADPAMVSSGPAPCHPLARHRPRRTGVAALLFAIDWLDFIARLDLWEGLRPASRRAFLSLASAQRGRAREFGDDIAVLTARRFLVLLADRETVRVDPSAAGFIRAVRFMTSHDVTARHDDEALHSWITGLLSLGELRNVLPGPRGYWGMEADLARQVASASWPRTFVEDVGRARLCPERVRDVARRLVSGFLEAPGPVALRELPERFPGIGRGDLSGAVTCAVSHLALFPVFLEGDTGAALTLWPPAAERHFAPPPPAPEPVEVDHTFDGAPLLEDMTTVLVAAAAGPLPMRQNDGALYARTARALEGDLMPLPAWLERTLGWDGETRTARAREMLESLGLTSRDHDEGGRLSLRATRAAAAWLALSAAGRLRSVLDLMRASVGFGADQPLPGRGGGVAGDDEDDDLDWRSILGSSGWSRRAGLEAWFFPHGASDYLRGDAAFATAALQDAFRDLPVGSFFTVHDFTHHRARAGNPVSASGPLRHGGYWHATDEDGERVWGAVVGGFVLERLVSLGGARVGVAANYLSFALTPAGRYLLGLTDAFEHATEIREGAVVVTPDLEVVFLHPAPAAEAAIARFAERVGRRVGRVFRLTPEFAYAGAAGGVTVEQALEALSSWSVRPVPPNVEHEVRGWFDRSRRVTALRALLLECPDPDTAGRVLAGGGKDVTMLSGTVLTVPDAKALARVSKRLAKKGVFVDRPRGA